MRSVAVYLTERLYDGPEESGWCTKPAHSAPAGADTLPDNTSLKRPE
jgi:hypothetical protein